MALTRREACMMIPALMAATASYGADEKPHSTEVLKSAIYNFKDLHVIKSADHNTYPMFEGKTHTGMAVQLHETELLLGAQPHPPHRHPAEEIFLVREGTVEVTIDGKRSDLTGGSVAYIASNALHGIRNVGNQPARYFVMQMD